MTVNYIINLLKFSIYHCSRYCLFDDDFKCMSKRNVNFIKLKKKKKPFCNTRYPQIIS